MGLNWHSATCVAISVVVVICSLQTGNVEAGCPSGFKTCGKNPRKPCLTSTKTDVKNCGCCGVKCPKGPNSTPICSNGRCNYRCTKNFHDCDGQSSNGCETTSSQLQTSPINCGKCGTKCPARANAIPTCVNGLCSARCNSGWKDCNNNMTDGCETASSQLQTSPLNCGKCGAKCPARANSIPICVNGHCSAQCNSGWKDCNNNMTDGCETASSQLQTSPLNCGKCGAKCPARANSIPICVNGHCSAQCNSGWKDCNNNMTDGCETFVVGSDPANCGQCDSACREDQLPNGVFKCSAGKCGLVWCYTGTDDCNGVLTDGCESIVVYNELNCGGCGLVCPSFPNAVPVCGGEICHAVCKEGFSYCYGVEVDERGCSRIDFTSDGNNCGACNVVCAAGTSCQGGTCV